MTDRPRTILVFGAGGQVGHELIQRSAPPGFALLGLTQADADIADRAAVEGAVRRRNLALLAKDIGAVLVHLSNDYIFDGCKTDAFVENDPVAPTSAYGHSKEAGERGVRETMSRPSD
jgi:dTDP-4-dehydrorhamnose reductase